jgi:superfamily II DNA or RNA helicase
MQHDIIDNRSVKLVETIQQILPGCSGAKFAVGYFFVSGLSAVASALDVDNIKELRLLIGNVSNRETIEQIAEGYRRLEDVARQVEGESYPPRTQIRTMLDEAAADVRTTLEAMGQSDEDAHLIGTLMRLISAGKLHVRVYTKGRLHSKAYIFDYGPVYDVRGTELPRPEVGIAVVGSSNFSLSGISHNTELNVIVNGNANHAALTAWFNELWDEAEDFKTALMTELKGSWAQASVSPYDLYLKTLYELVKERLEADDEAVTISTTEIMSALTEFQAQAMRRAIRMIRQYGGCFVSDVVGLGKSYIGSAIVKYFERTEQARPLIICPAPLVDSWEKYNEIYQLNARVLSMGYLREDGETGVTSLMSDIRFRDRDFVLIDESHNFRNANTQRYRVLEAFLSQGRRCVLLTATPRNKSVHDIYNQLKLFHQSDQTTLPIHPPNLREYFRLVEEGERPLPSLLSNILIRRTRNHVLRWYGYDVETNQPVDPDNFTPYRTGERRAYVLVQGKPQVFPKRELRTIEYSIEDAYQGLYEQLRRYMGHDDQTDGDRQLTYARYGLWNYVRKAHQSQSPYFELQRAGANLRGLMRISMFKRLESSVFAFRETVRRQLAIHEAFLKAIDAGIVAAGQEAQSILYESDVYEEGQLLDALEAVAATYRLEDFNAAALRRDIKHDCEILGEMLQIIEAVSPQVDSKLQTLLAALQQKPLNTGKCLIFTQYADTARYLYENLRHRPRVEVIFSDRTSKMSVVGRFAPVTNPEHAPTNRRDEIDLLVATDVLSEGLNLQDCDKLVNYDLHWNPVRLIQRFGRIDRIGSTYDTIYGFNFLPETALDAHLGLREKLSARIQEIHTTIGEDAAVLEPGEQLNEEAMYAIYAGEDISIYEDDESDRVVELDEAEEIIRQLQRDDPERFKRIVNLRHGIRTARRHNENSTFVFCRAGQYHQLYLLDDMGAVVSREIPYILGRLKCEPDEAALPLPEGYNERVAEVLRRFSREVESRKAETAQKPSLPRSQKYILSQLRIIYGLTSDKEIHRRIELLERAFSQMLPRVVVAQLEQLRKQNPNDDALLTTLFEIYDRYNLNLSKAIEKGATDKSELPILVCSEAISVGGNE